MSGHALPASGAHTATADPRPSAAAAAAGPVHAVAIAALARTIACHAGETLFEAARRAGVRIVGACGGRGTCGSCIVRVVEGELEPDHGPGGDAAAGHAAPARKWLRACRVRPRSDLRIEIAPRSLAPIVRADVATGAAAAALPLAAAVQAQELACPAATLADPAADTERVRRALQPRAPTTFACEAVRTLPELLRAHAGRLQARMRGGEVVGFARPGAPLLGLAVDLGTTNAAAFLLDLASGQRLASLGLENPQVAWGADLVSRLNHAVAEPAAARALQHAAVTVLNALAHDLTQAVQARPDDIAEVVVCGNTAMQHLLAGWPVGALARAPFVSVSTEAMDLPAQALGLQAGTGARLHLAPAIGGFVGGDHVAALLATQPVWQQPGSTLVMDIGTNTEISLVRQDTAAPAIWSASLPSGPALEGGHIGSGMRAAEGAIERVHIVDDTLQLGVIGNGPPIGLCGSGVLDALASFVQAGWVDARGRIVAPQAARQDGVRAITLAPQRADAPAVHFTQHDVRAVQLAKSAIRSGVQMLAREAGLDELELDRFIIAGAFGAYLRIDSAIAIGLLPALPPRADGRSRIEQVGNAAGLGVQQMLASTARRADATALAARCRCVELSSRPDFQKTFLHHIGFPT